MSKIRSATIASPNGITPSLKDGTTFLFLHLWPPLLQTTMLTDLKSSGYLWPMAVSKWTSMDLREAILEKLVVAYVYETIWVKFLHSNVYLYPQAQTIQQSHLDYFMVVLAKNLELKVIHIEGDSNLIINACIKRQIINWRIKYIMSKNLVFDRLFTYLQRRKFSCWSFSKMGIWWH